MSEYINQINLDALSKLLTPDYKNISIIAFGKRGIILKAKKNNLDVAIKMLRPESEAKNALVLEAKYLSEVNKLNIGPKLIEATEKFVTMEFIEGERINEWISTSTKDEILGMLTVLFYQLFKLDKSELNKSEMTNPYKHIIIKKDLMPVMIDFERMRFSLKPQNITQFAQYLTSGTILPKLQEKNILLNIQEFKEAIRTYSKSRKEFPIIDFLTN